MWLCVGCWVCVCGDEGDAGVSHTAHKETSKQKVSLCSLPMTRMRVLAVMLVTTLVATHSHSPWSSLLRDRNCKLPLGRMLCLLLLGFPTCEKKKSWSGGESRKRVLNVAFHNHLSPGDGWYIRVSRSSTGDDQLSPSLLTVLPTRSYVKVRRVLRNQSSIIGLKSSQRGDQVLAAAVPLAPKWQGETCPWFLGHCKAHRCRCPGSLLLPRPPGYFRLASGSSQGTEKRHQRVDASLHKASKKKNLIGFFM